MQRKPMRRRYRSTGFAPAVRATILDRDGWRCVPALACEGRPTMALVAHHRRNRQMGGSTDPVTQSAANGIACCNPCDVLMESDALAAEDAVISGWKVSAYADPRNIPVECPRGHELVVKVHPSETRRECPTCALERYHAKRRSEGHPEGPKRGAGACINGHEFTPENTYVNTAGRKVCRTCKRARGRVYAAARRQERRIT